MENLQTRKSLSKQIKRNENNKYQCPVCNNEFAGKTHVLNVLSRLASKNEPFVVRSFELYSYYKKYYECCYKEPTYEKFIEDRLFYTFVNFVAFVDERSPILEKEYFAYCKENKINIDCWADDTNYREFVIWINGKQSIWDSMERTLKFVAEYAEQNQFHNTDYLKVITTNTLSLHLKNGNISPWFLYATNNGRTLMSKFTEFHYERCGHVINADVWGMRIHDNNYAFASLSETLSAYYD